MSNTKFPLTINGVRFQVNPRSLKVSKPLMYDQLRTMGGVRFQIWYPQPEVLTINGISAGDTAYKELLFLKNTFETTDFSNVSFLFYKTQGYRGFITRLEVGHSLDAHQRFPYEISFQLLFGEKFNIHELSLEPSGVVGEIQDYIEENINAPIARFGDAINKTIGKVI